MALEIGKHGCSSAWQSVAHTGSVSIRFVKSEAGSDVVELALKLFSEEERTIELERSRLAWTCEYFEHFARDHESDHC